MRINVTGNAGAGKSTLARRISRALQLPLIEMDRIVWESGWQPVPSEMRRDRLLPLLEGDSWIVDGVSRHARHQADLVIFLDLPPLLCAWRCAKRGWKHSFLTRPELPDNCPEWRIIPTLIRIIFSFPQRAKPLILKDIAERNADDIVIANQAQIDAFEAELLQLSRTLTRRVDAIQRVRQLGSAHHEADHPGRDVPATGQSPCGK